MAVTTTNLGVITAYGDAVAAGYTGTKAEWQALMASYATVGQQAVDAKNDAVAAKNTAVSKATEATTAASTATTKANEASASAQSIAQSAAQIQENTDDIDQLKSDFADMESDGVVPSAEQILTDKGITDSVPYHHRKTGGDGADRLYDQIVGGSLTVNQLIQNGDFSNGTSAWTNYQSTLSASNKECAVAVTSSNGGSVIRQGLQTPVGHKFVAFAQVKSPNGNQVQLRIDNGFSSIAQNTATATSYATVANIINCDSNTNNGRFIVTGYTANTTFYVKNCMFIDLTAMFGSTIADYIYQLEQSTAGAGVAFFKALFPNDYYPYNSGELVSVSGLSEHKMVGFNKFDKSTVLNGYIINDATGDVQAVSGGKVTDYISVIPNQTYYIKSDQASGAWGAWYDADKNYISSITGYIKDSGNVNKLHTAPSGARYMRLTCFYNNSGDLNTFCVNISDPARNGEYEPYKAHRYPLDSTLILRGTPQLVDEKIKWDGDTYDADGTVTRRYGVVDLGTLSWTKSTDYVNPIFYANISDIISGVQDKKLVCTKYDYVVGLSAGTVADYTTPVIGTPATNMQVIVRDPNYDSSDATTFKTAMSGVYLVYRLATPTTEQADPYQHLQQCDPNGTEEYVSTGIVPIGHNSFYPENLRAKIEQLPWNFASLIAPTEATFTATRNYTTGALFIVDNVLYKATSNIANGGTITPNTNCTATTLAEIISALA